MSRFLEWHKCKHIPYQAAQVLAQDNTITGTITALNGVVSIPCQGADSFGVLLTGTWVGTITPEVSVDGATWAATAFFESTTETKSATVTANGTYKFLYVGGVVQVRVRASAYTSGTIAVALAGTEAELSSNLSFQGGAWNVTNISGTVALPTGAATGAKQDTGNTSLASIDGKITAVNTGAVVVASSALPAGASTSASQTTGNTSLSTIAGAVAGTEMQVDVLTMPTTTVQATNLDIRDLTFAADKVDASGSTGVGVTGTFFQATQPVSAATLPLPTGASTAARQDTGNTSLATIAGAVSGSEMQVDVLTLPAIDVTIAEFPAAAASADNFANPTTTNVMAMGMVYDGATWDRALGNSTDGALVNLGANNDVTVTSGAITETNSATIAASLSVMDDWDESDRAKVNLIVGQAGIAAGTGVDGVTVPRVTLATNVALPTGTNVIGHVIADTGSTTAVTGNVTVVQATGTNLHMVVDSGVVTTVGAVTAITNALPAGTNAIGKLAANSGVDIGDVDITSIAAGDNNIGNVDIVTMPSVVIGSGTITSVTTVGTITNTVPTKEVRSATVAQTTVADTTTSTTILSSNTARLGATIENDSSAVLYLLLGSGTASATNYSVRMVQYAYYEVPYGFTAALSGVWASDPGDGAARVTEITT